MGIITYKRKYLAICFSCFLGNFNIEALNLTNYVFFQNTKDKNQAFNLKLQAALVKKNITHSIHIKELSNAINKLISDVHDNVQSQAEAAQKVYICFHSIASSYKGLDIFDTENAAIDYAIKEFNDIFMDSISLENDFNEDFINNLIDSIASITPTSWFGKHNIHEAFMDNFKVLLFCCNLLPKSIATVVDGLEGEMRLLTNRNVALSQQGNAILDKQIHAKILELGEIYFVKGQKMGSKFAYSVFFAMIYGYIGLEHNGSTKLYPSNVINLGIGEALSSFFKHQPMDSETANFIYNKFENSIFEDFADSYFNGLPYMFSYLGISKEGPVTPEVFKLKQAMDDILDKYINSKQSMNLLKGSSQSVYTDIFKKKASSDLGKACSELKKSLAFFISYTHQDEKKAQFIVKVLEALSEIESSGFIRNTVSTAFRDTVKDYLEKYKKKLERDH